MKIYNTMTRQKEEFIPLEEGKVKMYACGPTVYNYFHLGNARPFITFDTLRRFLEYIDYDVTFVQNFTDIDDKMIQRANAEGITVRELADRYIEEYYIDAEGLNILPAHVQPRATDSMDQIIEMVKTLVDKGYAYVAKDGVYFEALRFEDYGKLSHHNLDDLIAGASNRVNDNEDKRNSMDFALWKFKKDDTEPAWPSPWGEGRPGWHIECSAMIKEYLGDSIDIHGGGQDLVFPHHENEIAQSESATGEPFVKYWMHNGFVNIDNEKMSKSLGNFFTVRDIAEKFPYPVIRFFILTGHYRSPLNFSDKLLEVAQTSLQRIGTCVKNLTFTIDSRSDEGEEATNTEGLNEAAQTLKDGIVKAKEHFIEAMSDDLNTSDALAAIFDLVRLANSSTPDQTIPVSLLQQTKDRILELCGVLGLEIETEEDSIPDKIMALVEERTLAKSTMIMLKQINCGCSSVRLQH